MNDYTPVYETDVPMPRWELKDPFGRGAVRKARYEYKRKAAQCESYRVQLEDVLKARRDAVNLLAEELAHEQGVSAELERRLRESERARKSLGEKLTEATDALKAVKRDLEELAETHDKFVRAVMEKKREDIEID